LEPIDEKIHNTYGLYKNSKSAEILVLLLFVEKP